MVRILPAKVSRRCPYQVTILGTLTVYPQLYVSENHVIYMVLLRIITLRAWSKIIEDGEGYENRLDSDFRVLTSKTKERIYKQTKKRLYQEHAIFMISEGASGGGIRSALGPCCNSSLF